MAAMQLKQLLNHLPALKIEGSVEREVTGIAYDSRRVTPGSVFIALPGHNVDGYSFISAALERGAAAIISEKNGFSASTATRVKVADARLALAAAAAAYHQYPSRKLRVVGVTGTNGKTTVTYMLKQILEASGVRTGLLGTVCYEIGERVIPAQRTTPEALDLQDMLAQMLRAGCGACVMEVSSHALEQQRVREVEFDLGVFTNLTRDHLDFHGSMENYFAAKSKLFTALEQGSKPGVAVINSDDPFGARLVQEHSFKRLLTYGLNDAAEVRAAQIAFGKDGTRMIIQAGGQSFPCRLPLIGRHNVYNALAAVAAALGLEVELPAVQQALNAMRAAPGRLEPIALGQPFPIFVDYAHTEDALRNVLRTLRELAGGRLLLAFGCGGSRDVGKRARMGAVAAELADLTIITTDNPRKEQPAQIAAQVEAGYLAVRADGCQVELDRRRAIDQLIRLAQPNDTVLIAGKGHETYQEFSDTIVTFDDREYARETLTALGFGRKAGAR